MVFLKTSFVSLEVSQYEFRLEFLITGTLYSNRFFFPTLSILYVLTEIIGLGYRALDVNPSTDKCLLPIGVDISDT